MTAGGPAQLPAWLADPALRRLWDAARDRLERGHLEPAGRIVLRGLERAERHAIAGLLGSPIVADQVTVDLAALDAALRERSAAGGLGAVVATVAGQPLRDRRAERSAITAAREAPFIQARALAAADPMLSHATWIDEWLAGLRRSGLLARSDDAGTVMHLAVAVLSALCRPQARRGFVSRNDLAVRWTNDAHALDDGTVLAQVVRRGLACAATVDVPVSTSGRRRLWERYGVMADAVSTTCLTLGLLAVGSGPRAERLRMAAESGDPVHLTPWDLRGVDLTAPHGRAVLVCENPRVLEAVAERYGAAIPVVCTAGQPALVVLDVLSRLGGAGAALLYHGDFDWPGIAITNRFVAELGVIPWLMAERDYLAAVRAARQRDAALGLTGTPVDPVWDSGLGTAMRRNGTAVHEEAVLDRLLDGLAA